MSTAQYPGLWWVAGRNPYPPRDPSFGDPPPPSIPPEPPSRLRRLWDDLLPPIMFIIGSYFFYLEFTVYGARAHVLLMLLGFVLGPTALHMIFRRLMGRKD